MRVKLLQQIEQMDKTTSYTVKKSFLADRLNNITPANRKKIKDSFLSTFPVGRQQYYNIINGIKEKLSVEEAFFFCIHLDLEFTDFINPSIISEIIETNDHPSKHRIKRIHLMHKAINQKAA